MDGEEKTVKKTLFFEEIQSIWSFIGQKRYFTDWHVIWTIPDGQQTERKAVTACVIAAGLGISAGFLKVALGPVGATKSSSIILPRIGLFGRFVSPGIIGAAAYVYATSYAADFRKTSDEVNHFIGGATAGAIIGLRHLKPLLIVSRSVGLGVVGLMAAQIANKPFFQEFKTAPAWKPSYIIFGHRERTPSNLEHKPK
ncbi:LOW QUALITY PROTEIN: NADH dehydrogenase [ubiquinone] 1 alpha subcomplex subunit 11-like [Argopecten irradians]|uniref:LOW QUALITY PROTEIN: NADH dehydrogenase [ubiquinone] 1 alpha subcomplex subunit 11-like n=1 Tax=Argopecten irradians TaxID=31199 RepID=UPI00371029C3